MPAGLPPAAVNNVAFAGKRHGQKLASDARSFATRTLVHVTLDMM
jgi:hypothetical protein